MKRNRSIKVSVLLWLFFALLIPGQARAGSITSDDFHGSGLNTALWTFTDPMGGSTLSMSGTSLVVAIPPGESRTIWGSTNSAPRILQKTTNTDFEIEAKFDSALSQKYQIAGILVQETFDRLLRFDFYSNGTDTKIFAGTMMSGASSTKIYLKIANGIPLYLRVRRQGDTWTMSYSYTGQKWYAAGTFTQRLMVTEVGPYVGTEGTLSNNAPAYTGMIDYFFNTASPIVPEDGGDPTPPLLNVWYGQDQSFGQQGSPQAWINIPGNVTDPDGVASLQYSLNGGQVQPLTMGPDGMRLQSQGDFNVELAEGDLFCLPLQNQLTLTATDSLGNRATKDVNIAQTCGKVWPLPYVLDWGSAASINGLAQVVDGLWSLEADTVRPAIIGYDRLVAIGDQEWSDYEISVPVTIHSLDSSLPYGPFVGILMRWQGHYAWDSKQPRNGWWPIGALGGYDWVTDSGDYRLRIVGNNMVPIAEDWSGRHLKLNTPYIFKMRAETTGTGSKYYLKVWEETLPEPPSWDISGSGLSGGLQKGSLLLLSHYTDVSFGGVTITPGPFGRDITPPQITTISVATSGSAATIEWTTDEPATGSLAYGQTTAYESGTFTNNTLSSSHTVSITGLTPGVVYHLAVTAIDAAGNVTRSTDRTFSLAQGLPAIRSDNFNSTVLDTNIWTFINPNPPGDASMTMTGSALQFSVPAGTDHSIWKNGNRAPRVMQAAGNTDFEIEAKFDSALTQKYQFHGMVIEQDSSKYLRFDFYSDGVSTRNYIYGAIFSGGLPTSKINKAISNPKAPVYMRIRRQADTWTQSYSFDRQTWTTSGQFTYPMTVTKVGVYAGNEGGTGITPPAYTGRIDYFLNTVSP